nr:MAG TPA: hypothetical protein [Herelleviridae sp.]
MSRYKIKKSTNLNIVSGSKNQIISPCSVV